MKKFLSLVLALVMTMSLVTISAGATSFTDDSSIEYDDAIEVMQALGVIDGYTDGSFRPDTALNRGQAAKIICNLILGPTTAAALPVTSAPFSDVTTDNVFAGYIAFCAKEGIINGYTDGTFRPTGSLTGYAFLKMLLGALGYDAEIEGYTGVANWGINVAKQAIGIGLVDGNDDFAGTKTVTRQEACLYALNTLEAVMVEYDSKTTITIGDTTAVIGSSKAKDIENNATIETFKNDDKLNFAEKYFTDLKTYQTTDDFGRPADKWTLKNKEIGIFTWDADATYTAGVKGKTIKADTNVTAKDYDWVAYLNGEYVAEPHGLGKPASGTDWYDFVKATGTQADKKIGANGALTQVFLDDTHNIATVSVINTYVLQVDGDYDEDDEELKLTQVEEDIVEPVDIKDDYSSVSLTLSADDFDNLDQFADEDIVLVTVASDSTTAEIKSIAKAEKVTGKVDSYVSGDSVTVDGTKYEYSAKVDTINDYDKESEVDLYVDAYGYVIYAEATEGTDDYVYIDEFNTSSGLTKNGTVVAYAYFTDGTEGEITVSKVDGDKAVYDAENNQVNTYDDEAWFKYTEKNGKYELTPVTTKGNERGDSDLDSGTPITDYKDTLVTYVQYEKDHTVKATKETVFVVVDDDDVKVYTGIKNVPTIKSGDTADTVVRYTEDDGYAEYVFIDLGDNGSVKGSSSSSDVIFVAAYYKTGRDKVQGDYNGFYQYKAVVNGKVDQKVKFEKKSGYEEDALTYGLYVNVEYDSDTGYITDADLVDGVNTNVDDDDFTYLAASKVDSQKSGVITFNDGDENAKYYLADDCTIYVVKGGTGSNFDEVTTMSAKTLAKNYSEDDSISAVFGVKNSDGEYTALYVVEG